MTATHATGGVLALASVAIALLAMAGAARAQPSAAGGTSRFDIPAQPLAQALVRYSDLTGQAVLVDVGLVEGLRSRALQGEFEPAQALEILLADAPLAIRRASLHAFTLVPRRGKDIAARPPVRLPRLRETPYAAAAQRAVRQALCAAAGAQPGGYRALVQLWVDPAGAVSRVRLVQSTGSAGLDDKLREALNGSAPGPLPTGMPQPLTLLLQPRPGQDRECAAQAQAARDG